MDRLSGATPGQYAETSLISGPDGMHSRTAALIASVARWFDADVVIRYGTRTCDAKNMVAILFLDIPQATVFLIEATGRQAIDAICTLSFLAENGFCHADAYS